MANTIRAAMDEAIEKTFVWPLEKRFELQRADTFERFALPLAPVAGQLADAITTRAALARGAVEGNPFMRPMVENMPLFFALKLAAGAGMALTVKKLQDGGHTKAARVFSSLGTLTGAAPALWNLRLMQKL